MPNSLGALVCARPFWVSRFLWVAAALLIDLHTVGATETLHPWERKTFSIGTLNGSLILETYGPFMPFVECFPAALVRQLDFMSALYPDRATSFQ